MTDNEIIKALECCASGDDGCEKGCPLQGKCISPIRGSEKIMQNALDLINRQKEEIERLEKVGQEAVSGFHRMEGFYNIKCMELKVAKTEAYKEFAEKVSQEIIEAIISNDKAIAERERKHKVNRYEDNFCAMCDGKIVALSGIKSFIDNLLKELVGEDK